MMEYVGPPHDPHAHHEDHYDGSYGRVEGYDYGPKDPLSEFFFFISFQFSLFGCVGSWLEMRGGGERWKANGSVAERWDQVDDFSNYVRAEYRGVPSWFKNGHLL